MTETKRINTCTALTIRTISIASCCALHKETAIVYRERERGGGGGRERERERERERGEREREREREGGGEREREKHQCHNEKSAKRWQVQQAIPAIFQVIK